MALTFTGPGIYPGIPELDYHSCAFGPKDSLSSTGAKRILDCPAVYRWAKDNPQPPKDAFDFGHVVHALVLGVGLDIHVHDHESLRTKAAKEDVQAARDAGKVPISRADYERAKAAADAVRSHPLAARLLSNGAPEQSMYAQDKETGVWMRGRADWITGGIICDLKTAKKPNPDEWRRQAASFDYALQAAWYQTIYQAITGEAPTFFHIVVGVDAPHLVYVAELDFDFQYVGKAHMRRALDLYKQCLDSGEWPGYPQTLLRLGPPLWYVNDEDDLDSEIEVA